MATVDDQATAREELDRELALKRRAPTGPTPCGACHFCSEPLSAGLRWCDEHCRDDWEKEQYAMKQRAV